jgi:hypothetical protein
VHQLYINYKQAYGSITRAELVEITLANTNNKVKIQGELPPSFETAVGLRQGDLLSALLFNLCMEKVITNVKIIPGGTIFNRTRQCLAYADHVVIILGRSIGYITETIEETAAVAPQIGLHINNTKTKYMVNRYDKNELKENEILGKNMKK